MTKRKSRARKRPSAPQPFTGDHGPNMPAATQGTVIEAVEGQEHNRTGRRRRVEAIEQLTLSMRQEQAAKRIRDAYCRVQKLTSGGPLKEQVDSSPKPDAVVAAQVDAQSELVWLMGVVPRDMRPVVEWVCWENRSLRSMAGMREMNSARFKVAMDLVANRCRY